MNFKHFIVLALTLISHSSYASTYITKEGAEEGIKRGKEETFVSPVGQILLGGNGATLNGTLVSEKYIITSKHIKMYFNKDFTEEGSCIIFDPDVSSFLSKYNSLETLEKDRKKLIPYIARLDISNAKYHPNENVDLALIPLKDEITGVSPMPINYEKPKNWSSGYFVTFSDIYSLATKDKCLGTYKRHISIIKPFEKEILDLKTEKFSLFLVKEWKLDGYIKDQRNHKFIPEEKAHKLTAFSFAGDSGAAFITKKIIDEKLYLSAIHKGKVLMEDASLFTLMIPLYVHKEWIQKIIGE